MGYNYWGSDGILNHTFSSFNVEINTYRYNFAFQDIKLISTRMDRIFSANSEVK